VTSIRDNRCGAPWARLELKRVLRNLGLAQIRRQVVRRGVVIRRGIASHPQADTEVRCVPQLRPVLPQPFEGADQRGRALELLARQEPQGVSGEYGRPASTRAVDEPSADHLECCESEIRLRLATTGREPDEIHDVAIGVGGVRGRGQAQQLKTELEMPPPRLVHFVTGLQRSIQHSRMFSGVSCLKDLLVHGRVREPERQQACRIVPQQRDSLVHAAGRSLHALEDARRRRGVPHVEPGRVSSAVADPSFVDVHEGSQILAKGVDVDGFIGQPGNAEHVATTLRRRNTTNHDGGQHLRPNRPDLAVGVLLPVHGTTVPHPVDASSAVEESQFLVLGILGQIGAGRVGKNSTALRPTGHLHLEQTHLDGRR
jgi:hypothetical protein